MEALFKGESDTITRKMIEMAKQGNPAAMRLYFDRMWPARRGRAIEFDLPAIEKQADVVKASFAVMATCAEGEMTPAEAQTWMSLIQTHAKLFDGGNAKRAAELEQLQRKPQIQARAIQDRPENCEKPGTTIECTTADLLALVKKKSLLP